MDTTQPIANPVHRRIGLPLGGHRQSAEDSPSTGDANLKETLTFGLKPRLPTEYEFIDLVITKVDAGVLPLELVIGTFRWAGGRRPYPFPYFERALRLCAVQYRRAIVVALLANEAAYD